MGKKKKDKIRYYDDGSSVADMSSFKKKPTVPLSQSRPKVTAKEQAQTFFGVMKMMFVPMLTVICALGIIYMLMYFLFFLMA